MKILIVISAIFAFLPTKAQERNQVYKFKAFQTSFYNNSSSSSNDISWNNTDILVVINLDKNKIQIYAKKTVDLDLLESSSNEDADGNTILSYSAIDEDGIKCRVNVRIFKDQSGKHKATLIIKYSDISVAYRLMSDE